MRERGRQPERSTESDRQVERSPFFRPTTPRTLTEVKSPGGTVRLKKKAAKSDEAKSGILGTVANLVMCIVGSGIVGIPFAIRESGLVAGTAMVIICAILTDKSLRLLIETGKHIDAPSYETLMEAVFGRFGFIFISINMFISSFGGMVSYLIIIKDTIPLLFGVDIDNEPVKRAILVVSSMALSLPLAMQRDMANLSKTSVISALFDTLMVGIVAFFSPLKESVAKAGGIGEILSHSTIRPDTLFIGLGVLSFAFVCQDSCFIIAGSLDRPTKDRWAKVTGLSLTTCGSLAIVSGVCGYLAFLQDTEGNVLNNFEGRGSHAAATAARALLGSTMFFVYPLASYVVRHVMVVLLFQGRRAHEGDDHTILARKDRRVALTLLIYGMALVPAIFLNDLGTVLSFAGAIAGSCLSYIGPGTAYLAVHGQEFMKLVNKWFAYGPIPCMLGYPDENMKVGKGPLAQVRETESEMVPLTSVGLSLDDDADTESSASKEPLSCVARFVLSIVGFLLWYALLMPIWCLIAATGMQRLAIFQEEQSLKSPRPNRLGKIVRRGNANGAPNRKLLPPALPGKNLRRTASDTMSPERARSSDNELSRHVSPGSYGATLDSTGHSASGQYGNQAIAKAISSSMEKMSGNSLKGQDGAEEGEEDPQAVFPSVYDFFVAISFTVLGVLAMTIGIGSILMNG